MQIPEEHPPPKTDACSTLGYALNSASEFYLELPPINCSLSSNIEDGDRRRTRSEGASWLQTDDRMMAGPGLRCQSCSYWGGASAWLIGTCVYARAIVTLKSSRDSLCQGGAERETRWRQVAAGGRRAGTGALASLPLGLPGGGHQPGVSAPGQGCGTHTAPRWRSRPLGLCSCGSLCVGRASLAPPSLTTRRTQTQARQAEGDSRGERATVPNCARHPAGSSALLISQHPDKPPAPCPRRR